MRWLLLCLCCLGCTIKAVQVPVVLPAPIVVTDTLYIAPYHAHDFIQSMMTAVPGKILGYHIEDSTHVTLLLENWDGAWIQKAYKWDTQWNCWNLENE